MMSRGVVFTIIVAAVLTTACNRRPSGVLSDDEAAELIADMQIADAYATVYGMQNTDMENLKEGVMAAHGVSRAEFDSTMAYYGRNMDEYYKLFDKVNRNIEKKSRKVGAEGLAEAEGNNIWRYSPFVYISPNFASDGIVFSFDAGDLTPGEQVEWKMRLNDSKRSDLLLGVEYADGSTAYVKKNTSDRKLSLNLQTDSAKTGKRIFGFMTVDRMDMPLWVDSISLNVLPFDSLKYSQINIQQRYSRPANKPITIKKDTVSSSFSLSME